MQPIVGMVHRQTIAIVQQARAEFQEKLDKLIKQIDDITNDRDAARAEILELKDVVEDLVKKKKKLDPTAELKEHPHFDTIHVRTISCC